MRGIFLSVAEEVVMNISLAGDIIRVDIDMKGRSKLTVQGQGFIKGDLSAFDLFMVYDCKVQ